jgi:hypothetical protein
VKNSTAEILKSTDENKTKILFKRNFLSAMILCDAWGLLFKSGKMTAIGFKEKEFVVKTILDDCGSNTIKDCKPKGIEPVNRKQLQT